MNPIQLFELDWLENTSLVPIGEHVRIILLFLRKKPEKRSVSHNAPVTNTDESRRERRHASSRARRRQPLFFFFAAQARKLSFLAPLAWCFGSIPRFSCCLGDRAVRKIAIATAMVFFEAPPPGYAVLWSAGVGAAGAPVAIRRGSRFIASAVVVDKYQTADGLPRGRWPSVNMPRQSGSNPQIQFNPIQSIFGLRQLD